LSLSSIFPLTFFLIPISVL